MSEEFVEKEEEKGLIVLNTTSIYLKRAYINKHGDGHNTHTQRGFTLTHSERPLFSQF